MLMLLQLGPFYNLFPFSVHLGSTVSEVVPESSTLLLQSFINQSQLTCSENDGFVTPGQLLCSAGDAALVVVI